MPVNFDAAAQSRPVRLRIGPFELNPKSGELTTEDRRFVLQQQPLQLLLMLIQRGGEMVTRDEIQKQFWGDDVIVDFDHSINTAVRKLRRALGDSAEAPAYIETLGRRGYRLKIPVEVVERRPNSTTRNNLLCSPITLPAFWKESDEGKHASSGPRLAVGVEHNAVSTERGFAAPHAFRCRRPLSHAPEQRGDDFAPSMGVLAARRLCEKLISAVPAEMLETLRQLILQVAEVLETSI